ncbi:aminopeptidase N [Candidatus Photodesmus blepharus]|uniref:aminopeptidase N n=1 Tax=Candidatus Photodesmus blepharonis TaxID=1179155 RepID=UPI00055813B5|nr:aminopeptidase N [Candidatus Photodesmus blepharus]
MDKIFQTKYRKNYQPPSYKITDVELIFDLFDTQTLVNAKSRVVQIKKSEYLYLDGEDLELKKILVNGKSWKKYVRTDKGITLNSLPRKFELSITTLISPESNTTLEGLYKSNGVFCTQCEAEGFRRITYFLDRPDVLAKYTTIVIADKVLYPYLLSNGNCIDQGELAHGRHWMKWQDPYPKPSYLFALVAGNFDVLCDKYKTRSGRDVELRIFVGKGNVDKANHAMRSLIKAMKWDEESFNLEYDLDVYMIVAVDFFNMGAMENKGLNIFNSKFVLASKQTATDEDYLSIEAVIAHEYFHNWTGNRVTCRDWFQLSLKEGLTVFREQEFSSDVGSRSVNRINNVRILRSVQFSEDASPISHPIRPETAIEISNFYTVTVYEKGSEVIRMLHTLLGKKKFKRGMQLYFQRYDATSTTCEDFLTVMEEASGINLNQFRLWYSQSGTPILKVSSEYSSKNQLYKLTIEQEKETWKGKSNAQVLHIPFTIELYTPNGDVIELQNCGQGISNLLNIKRIKQTFVFDNIREKPIPCMLTEFSAPVILKYNYSKEELAFLMRYSRNEFSRWDAGQMILGKSIRDNIKNVQNDEDIYLDHSVVDAFRDVLLNKSLDPAFVAEMMKLPNYNEVSSWYELVDVDSISKVLKSIQRILAKELEGDFTITYYTLDQKKYTIEHNAFAKRALRNVALSFLGLTSQANEIIKAQYKKANNMTDTIAAMQIANNAELFCREELMADFSTKWRNDSLVMEKWFGLQGSNPAENVLSIIKHAMKHEAFSLKNPNKVYSLIGSFFNMNPVRFHSKSGEGYKFSGEILQKLDRINPQIASNLIDPLLKFRRYDKQRQFYIKKELESMKYSDKLSKNLFEKIDKTLNME